MAQVKHVMRLEGVETLLDAFKVFPDEARARIGAAVSTSTVALARRVIASAPRGETGVLRDSIHSRLPARSGLTGRVMIDRQAFYWRFLEYGTVKMSARPFIRPSVEQEAPDFERRIRETVRDIGQRFPGRLT